jgi:hypothetical protein
MTGEAEDGGDDELRWATGAGAFHGRADYLKALCQVGAVQFIAFEAVTAGAINQVGAGKLAIVGSGISVMIIGRDHYQRNVLDRGDVHPFMGRAGLHSPFPNCR